MSICLTWFAISGLGKPKLYQNLGDFTRMWGFYLEVLCLCEELVGYCSYDEVHVHYKHACTREDFLLILYISNHNNRDTDRKKKSLHSRRREMLEISFPLLIIW